MSAAVEPPASIAQAAARLRAGECSSEELTRALLVRADAVDPPLGAYLARFDETALAAARAADAELAAGRDRGPLHGIPLAIKDILACAEGPTTAQSRVLDRAWGDGRDAPVVARLRAAGAVITGKTTTMEFAIGLPDPDAPFPVPRNPWDLARWPGGSSSGSGAAVAAGLVCAAIGTDTAGSIRIPAAFCGVSGLKPTYGRVPKSGCVPLGYSLDHVGPLAHTAADCAIVLAAIEGHDPGDPASSTRPPAPPAAIGDGGAPLAGVRIGVELAHHFPERRDPALRKRFDAALASLEGLGATLAEVTLPLVDEVAIALHVTVSSEALAHHLGDLRARWQDYTAGTRFVIASGALVRGVDYVAAQRVRRIAQRRLAALFDTVDVIATPTAAFVAGRHEQVIRDGADALMASIFTPYWNAVGNPVLALPMGFGAAGMPLGLQLAGRPFEEPLLLAVGEAYQGATDWHARTPPLRAGEDDGVPAPPPGPAPAPAAVAVIDALLAASGIEPGERERRAIVERNAGLWAAVETLHAVAGARYEDPALRFDPIP